MQHLSPRLRESQAWDKLIIERAQECPGCSKACLAQLNESHFRVLRKGNTSHAMNSSLHAALNTKRLQRNMSDFFGADFSSFSNSKNTTEFDFDRAASAFPDISLDDDDIPTFPNSPGGDTRTTSGFSFHDFDTAPSQSPVRVTGDDELEKFENEFPEIEVPLKQVSFVFLFSHLYL